MIVAIEGEIRQIGKNFCHLKTNLGITYLINISSICITNLKVGEIKEFKIVQILREDANLLYGFLDESEKNMFELLLKVSGIGPSGAINICSNITSTNFIKAVFEADIKTLTSLPGIGQKSAKKIVAELSDNKNLVLEKDDIKSKAFEALKNLGFKESEIMPLLKDIKSNNLSDAIKELLKKIK